MRTGAYNSSVTAIYVLRHPETTWNVEGRYQGRLEAPLSERGRQQLELVCDAFRGDRLDAVLSSGLQRASVLARALADVTRAPLHVDHRLTEIAQGPWEGLKHAQIRERFPELYREWHERPDNLRFPGGEALADVRARTLSVLREIFRLHPEGNVGVVTHSVVVQVIAAQALSLPLRFIHRLQARNASISTLCGDMLPGVLLTLGSTSHLHGSPVTTAEAENCVGLRLGRRTP